MVKLYRRRMSKKALTCGSQKLTIVTQYTHHFDGSLRTGDFPLGTIINKRTDTIVANAAKDARSIIARTIGLLGRGSMAPGEALIIRRCNMVHMLFMAFAIDVVFCTSGDAVLDTQEQLQPWRLSKKVWKATYVIEFPAGTIKAEDIRIGDVLEFRK